MGHLCPASQSEQDVDPAGAYVPLRHCSGVEAVVRHLDPAGHSVHVAEPALLYSPVEQLEQDDAPTPEYCPAMHWTGVLVVVDVHSKPAGQSVHNIAPARLYLPVPQGVCVVLVQEFPAVHWVQEPAPVEL